MAEFFFTTPDLTVASKLAAQGLTPQVVPQEGAPRALFKFSRTPCLTQVLLDLAGESLTENAEDVERARRALRAKAILVVESHWSRQ